MILNGWNRCGFEGVPILDSDQMVDRPEPTLTGLVLNEKYALQTRIGRGGMGGCTELNN